VRKTRSGRAVPLRPLLEYLNDAREEIERRIAAYWADLREDPQIVAERDERLRVQVGELRLMRPRRGPPVAVR
jgi:hypothetical protein